MDTTPTFLHAEHNDLNLDLSKVGDTDAVKLKKIENLHEGVSYKAGEADDDVDEYCAECNMPHPCATYKIINPPNYDGEAP
jgi:hypothetical protein